MDTHSLQTMLQETQDRLVNVHRKYKVLRDVEHSDNVAALVHLIVKDIKMLVQEKTSAVELNRIFQEKPRELDESLASRNN